MSGSQSENHDHDHLPIEGRGCHNIARIEYREIIRGSDDGQYTNIGSEMCNGDIADALKLAQTAQTQGGFPCSRVASPPTDLPYKDSSKLSIKFEDDICLYVFKLSDDSQMVFDNSKHLFGIRLLPHYGQNEISKLKEVFSDPHLISDHKQWACFVLDGKKSRKLKDDGMRLAFDFHDVDEDEMALTDKLPHPPYWPPHPPDFY